jgi:hypothetical protein
MRENIFKCLFLFYSQFQSISYLHDNNLAMEGNGTKNVESGLLSDAMCLYDATHADLFNFSPTHMKKGCGNSTNIPDIEITGKPIDTKKF